MREMKDSGIEWIGEIPTEWSTGRVKHIFTRKNEKAMQEDPIILSLARSGVRVRDVSNNEGQVAENYFNYNPVNIDDLLLNPMDLYSGANCSISRVVGVISPAYVNLRSKDRINPVFYDYYFKVQYWVMAFFAHGKGVSYENRWTLNIETLMNFPVIILSYEEQCRRADYLDNKCGKIDAIIAHEQTVIEKLKAYKQSIIIEAVTKGLNPHVKMKDSGIEWIGEIPEHWKISKFKTVFTYAKGLPIIKADLLEKGIAVISYGQIHSKKSNGLHISDELIRYVSKEYLESNPNSIAYYGDILFADTSEDYLGIGNCIYNDFGNIFAGYHTIITRPINNEIFSKYQAFLFKSDVWRSQMRSLANGIKVYSITQKMLNRVSIICPPFAEQQQIADYLDQKCAKIESSITKKQSVIDKLTEYKKSLIYEVVTGKKEV